MTRRSILYEYRFSEIDAMTRLEDLTPNAAIRGIIPDQTVTVVNTQWFGSEALELTYKDPSGKVADELLYRYDESRIELVESGRPWSLTGMALSFGSFRRRIASGWRIFSTWYWQSTLAPRSAPAPNHGCL